MKNADFTNKGFMKIFPVFCFKVGPAKDRIVRECSVHDDPGVFLQDQVQVLEFWDTEAQLGAESLYGGLHVVEMISLDLTLPGGKYRDFILSVVKIYSLQKFFVQSELLLCHKSKPYI